jgi:hypothetical protein
MTSTKEWMGYYFWAVLSKKILTKEEIKGNHDAPMVVSVVLVQLCPQTFPAPETEPRLGWPAASKLSAGMATRV